MHNHNTCISTCIRCAEACEECSTACLGESDVGHMTECIRLDRDCAAICWLAASLMSRDSQFVQQICELCAAACEACAAECETHDHDHCKRCAAACRSCAEECRSMVGAAA